MVSEGLSLNKAFKCDIFSNDKMSARHPFWMTIAFIYCEKIVHAKKSKYCFSCGEGVCVTTNLLYVTHSICTCMKVA